MELSVFFTNLGLKAGDIIQAINDKTYSPDKVHEILYDCDNWKENDPITLKIKRDGKTQTITGTVKLTFEEKEGYIATDTSKNSLREAWLKG